MKDKLKFIQHNKVWESADLSKSFKPIVCQWVFKTKKDSRIDHYKAKLVANDLQNEKGLITMKPSHLFGQKILLEPLWFYLRILI